MRLPRLITVPFLFVFFYAGPLSAQQNHPISRYDDEVIRNIAIPDLLKNFENALNVISYSGAEPMDFKTIRNRLLKATEGERVFYDENVILENDLHFDDWSNKTKEDVDIRRYLENFNLLYPKTQDPTVTFTLVGISSLKKKTYLYYNVLFDSKFSNKDMNDNPFTTVRRIAEVRLKYDTAWVAYFNGIRFAPQGYDVSDKKNDFMDYVVRKDRGVDNKYALLAQKKSQQQELQQQIARILTAGDKFMVLDDYFSALDVYKDARLLDPYNDDVRLKISQCEAAIELDKQNKKLAQDRIVRQHAIKKLVWKSYYDRDFSVCKTYFDSLTINYGQDLDDTLRIVSSGLQSIAPFISRVNYLEKQLEFELALEYTTKVIRDMEKKGAKTDSVLLAEAYYCSGKLFYDMDSMETADVIAFCEVALRLSENRHKPARQLLIYSKLNSKRNRFQALDIATAMVNGDPKNPDNRALRAYVYLRLNDPENALNEYQLAIDLGAADSAVYISKAQLELAGGKYNSCVSTTTLGLSSFPCNSNLYYLRILSQEAMGLMNTAGVEFQKALVCGLTGALKDTVLQHGSRYFNRGLQYYNSGRMDSALACFSRSFELSRNPDALFYRGLVFQRKGDSRAALSDFNRLIQLDSTYPQAYYTRGRVKASMGNHESALLDYRAQLVLDPNNSSTYAACGISEYSMLDYENAAASFEKSNSIAFADSVSVMAVRSYYSAGVYGKTIALANKYIPSINDDNSSLLKYRGMAEYRIGKYKDAEADLQGAIKAMPDDYETNHFLAMNYLVRGDAVRAMKHADRAALACNDCAEGLAWSAITSLFQQRQNTDDLNRSIDKMTLAMRKDTAFDVASNHAWIAYAWLLTGDASSRFVAAMKRAEELGPEDPVMLFVKSCSQAAAGSDCSTAAQSLKAACLSGFPYKTLLEGDPNFRRCHGDPEYKKIVERFFRN